MKLIFFCLADKVEASKKKKKNLTREKGVNLKRDGSLCNTWEIRAGLIDGFCQTWHVVYRDARN